MNFTESNTAKMKPNKTPYENNQRNEKTRKADWMYKWV